MQIFFAIIILVFAILQLILFFKIWGMTNDIREIKMKYLSSDKFNTSQGVFFSNFPEGTLVVNLLTEKQMRTGQQTSDGKYKCYSNSAYVGSFSESEIMEFDEWVKNNK